MSTKTRKRQIITVSRRTSTKTKNARRRMLTEQKNTNKATSQTKSPTKNVGTNKNHRKERNRINARKFRERRKIYVEQLEKETKTLKEQNSNLNSQLEKVQNENEELRVLIEQLQKNNSSVQSVREQKEQKEQKEERQEQTEDKNEQVQAEAKSEEVQVEVEAVLSSNDIYEIDSPTPNNFYEDLEMNLQSAIHDFQRVGLFEDDFSLQIDQQENEKKPNLKNNDYLSQYNQWLLNLNDNSQNDNSQFFM
ncbi:bzip-type transcription factor-related [Anaeramoeba flamelloides]|uniref:Bzip-type transcription factor-related n=1 Tax=Anaeramoeba flamelloides TaxID=1746091 RepID=A0ABQ8Y1K0_9EUKA|nr:bzip-type transcription factor-related [Anaeramoeba flamelloides]